MFGVLTELTPNSDTKSTYRANMFTLLKQAVGGMSFVGLYAFTHLVRLKYFFIFRLIPHI